MKDQRGHSLVELIISSALISLVVLGVSAGLFEFIKYFRHSRVNQNLWSAREILIHTIDNDCAWANTVADESNTSLSCLRDFTSCSAITTPMPLALRDMQNQVHYDSLSPSSGSGLDSEGRVCSLSASGDGSSSSCPYRYSITWEPVCVAPCTRPQIRIQASLSEVNPSSSSTAQVPLKLSKFNASIIRNHNPTYRTCKDALDRGNTLDGMYLLDPDGAGGQCAFWAYCDMNADGGGWTLLANASMDGYTSLPILKRVNTQSIGRLSDEKIVVLMENASNETNNNLRIKVDNLVISMRRAPASISRAHYFASDDICLSYEDAALNVGSSSSSEWGLFASTSAPAKVGFLDGNATIAGITGYAGFVCDKESGAACGAATCTGTGIARRGSLWMR